ncbi:MAG: vWA domain-containing protein [Candidatus Margulisiibacteriota bacterium]
MKKSLFLVLFAGITVLLLSLAALTGCSTTSSTSAAPGLLTTPEAVLSGTAVVSGSTVSVKLNAILISGEAITGLTGSRFKVYAGTSSSEVTGFSELSATVSVPTTSKIDMVFILDNTGSMAGRISSVKDSIVAFTSSLEAGGADVNFGVVSFGDDLTEQATLELPATATEVKDWLDALPGESGGDAAENPLDSLMVAYNDFTWRSDAQKVFVLITDVYCHQVADGTSYTARTVVSVESALAGNALVYVVSPKYTYDVDPYGDTRWLADGYGAFDGVDSTTYGVTRPHIGTGGKWIELESSGDIDLNTLGISTSVTKGYTLAFSYTVSGSTLYIHVLVDTDGDGVYDCDGLITLSISTAGAGKWMPNGQLANPALGVVKGGSNN